MIENTDFTNLGKKYEGKVRDNYTKDDKRIIITTDRLSAFDRVITSIPWKGQVLNQMAAFWFEKTKDIIPNHLIEVPDPNVIVAHECDPVMVEIIVRAYVTGTTKTSIWHNYENGVRDFCGNKLPEGLTKDQKLPHPIITPTTKAVQGEHDESISMQGAIERGLLSAQEAKELSEAALKLFARGEEVVRKQGIILVDTKYEFGRKDGKLVLIDEIHTPDSSRFWFADTYQRLFAEGKEQRRIDKDYVRTYLSDQGFRGDGPIPPIPPEVREEASRRYIEAFERITGKKFEPVHGGVERVRRNLARYE